MSQDHLSTVLKKGFKKVPGWKQGGSFQRVHLMKGALLGLPTSITSTLFRKTKKMERIQRELGI